MHADASEVNEIGRFFGETKKAFGRIDIVVANAGIEKVNVPVADVTEEDFDLLFRISTNGPYFVMQAAARHIVDGGRIINIASSSTVRPRPGLGLYGTSKTAPKYPVRVLTLELEHRQIAVNSLVPGYSPTCPIVTPTRSAYSNRFRLAGWQRRKLSPTSSSSWRAKSRCSSPAKRFS